MLILDEQIDEIREQMLAIGSHIEILEKTEGFQRGLQPQDSQTVVVSQTIADKDKIIEIVGVTGAEVREILAAHS